MGYTGKISISHNGLQWLLVNPDGFYLYTDHNNVIFIFDSLSLIQDLSLGSVRMVLSWAVILSNFNFVCYHMAGTDNLGEERLERLRDTPLVRRFIYLPPLLTHSDEDF